MPNIAESYTLFARAEYVQKTGEELGLPPDERKWGVKQFTLGISRELVTHRPWQLALGAAIGDSVAAADLDSVYGAHPIGHWIFVRLRPAAMDHK